MSKYFMLMRFHRPIGTILLLMPVLWGLLHYAEAATLKVCFIFFVGTLMTRSMGCVYNDLIDKKIDCHVQRTKKRPLAHGDVKVWQGWVLFMLLCYLSLSLLFFLPKNCFFVGVISFFLVLFYPWMKRWTSWPQIFLGITMNMGFMMIMVALAPKHFWLRDGIIFLAGFVWTFVYDTLYAHQDRKDDVLLGIGSSAVKLGEKTKPVLISLTGVMAMLFFIHGVWCQKGPLFFCLILYACFYLSWIIYKTPLNQPHVIDRSFHEMVFFGLMICLAYGIS